MLAQLQHFALRTDGKTRTPYHPTGIGQCNSRQPLQAPTIMPQEPNFRLSTTSPLIHLNQAWRLLSWSFHCELTYWIPQLSSTTAPREHRVPTLPRPLQSLSHNSLFSDFTARKLSNFYKAKSGEKKIRSNLETIDPKTPVTTKKTKNENRPKMTKYATSQGHLKKIPKKEIADDTNGSVGPSIWS